MNVTYRGRRAAVLENGALRVTVLEEGGHIAEIFDKRAGVSPLWTPPWASIEPSAYNPDTHPEYGNGPDAQLLAGIMGHNLCLDTFGAPSPEEFLAGVPVHGEASIVPYQIRSIDNQLVTTALAACRAAVRAAPRVARPWRACHRSRREPGSE